LTHAHDRGGPTAAGGKTAKFSFFTSMSDLVRLVMRSQARGLKTRLAGALVLVLLGKLAGVTAPLYIGRAIDRLTHGHGPGDTILLAFAAFAGAWVLLGLLASAVPFIRDSIFTPVSQAAAS